MGTNFSMSASGYHLQGKHIALVLHKLETVAKGFSILFIQWVRLKLPRHLSIASGRSS